ncbi:unnamed protein product [Ceutorhynchus assimilis]|uniref:DNA repair protein XRCC4 n=1 Tax=Ceutorhynchus assimilis TaxID=467358 RepID=A0A9P0DD06_9CUCU|nr:unnamed protein product [Ceutorhynchus assimilis]
MNHFYQAVESKGKPCFKISSLFQTDILAIMIFQNETAWEALVTEEELKSQSRKHTTVFQDYCTDLREYLHMNDSDKAQLNFKDGMFTISLGLKNKMKMQFFQTRLYQVNFHDSVFSLVDQLYNKNFEHLTELNSLRSQFENLKNDHQILEEKMNEFLNRRKAEELNTYNNFIAILNEKKREIQHLNELLIAFRQGRPTVNKPFESKKKQNTKKPIIEEVPDSQSSSDNESVISKSDSENELPNYNTDEEKYSNNNKTIAVKRSQSPVPSTSKCVSPDSSSRPFQFPTKRIRTEVNNYKPHFSIPKEDELKVEKNEEEASCSNSNNVNSKKVATVELDTQELLDNIN